MLLLRSAALTVLILLLRTPFSVYQAAVVSGDYITGNLRGIIVSQCCAEALAGIAPHINRRIIAKRCNGCVDQRYACRILICARGLVAYCQRRNINRISCSPVPESAVSCFFQEEKTPCSFNA